MSTMDRYSAAVPPAAAVTADPAGAGSSPGAASPYPLVRLTPFDGLFLRAEHLAAQVSYANALSRLGNVAGGSGVVQGLEARLVDGGLVVSPGLAIDPLGRVLAVTDARSARFDKLIASSASSSSPGSEEPSAAGTSFGPRGSGSNLSGGSEGPGGSGVGATTAAWVLELRYDERPSGREQVYNGLCDVPGAPSGGGTAVPYVVEYPRLRLVPLRLDVPLPTTNALGLGEEHLRSRYASAWFESERRAGGALVPGSERAGSTHADLGSAVWRGGAAMGGGDGVPLALLIRAGAETWLLDQWTTRRERVETPTRVYWAGRVAMRPWSVFWAQVLQFQSQLAELGLDAKARARTVAPPPALARAGILELPPAGYLPIGPALAPSVDEQVRHLLGDGVEARFRAVRPDYVAHALEQAQHLDRISLVEGLDDPRRVPKVDILVPDGRLELSATVRGVRFFAAAIAAASLRPFRLAGPAPRFEGLGRFEESSTGRLSAAFAGVTTTEEDDLPARGLWLDAQVERSPFDLRPGEWALVAARVAHGDVEIARRFDLAGRLICDSADPDPASGLPAMRGRLDLRIQADNDDVNDLRLGGRLSLTWEAGRGFVLTAELTQVAGVAVTGRLDIVVRVTSTGRWHVTVDREDAPVRVDAIDDPLAFRPGQTPRTRAERAVEILRSAGLDAVTVGLLFGGAEEPSAEGAYRTRHDWVFFTRRRIIEGSSDGRPAAPTIRLDLYVGSSNSSPEDAARAAAAEPEALLGLSPEFVAPVEWDGESYLLTPESAALLADWMARNPDRDAPGAATIWLGPLRAPHEFLAPQVLERLGAAPGVPVIPAEGQPNLSLSLGSSGVLLAITPRDTDDQDRNTPPTPASPPAPPTPVDLSTPPGQT